MTDDPIKALAEKYGLTGPDPKQDWYLSQGRPCLTKNGIGKIEVAEKIHYGRPLMTIEPPLVVVQGEATMGGETAYEVGSCRFDLPEEIVNRSGATIRNPSPEFCFAPEMAFKRWRGRCVVRLVAPGQTIYTEDEMAYLGDQHQRPTTKGRNPASAAPPPSAPPRAAAPPANGNARGWEDALGIICAITGMDRHAKLTGGQYDPDFETALLKDCAKFRKDDGSYMTLNTHPQRGYPNFSALLDKKPKWAGAVMETVQSYVQMLEEGRSVVIEWDIWDKSRGGLVWNKRTLTPGPSSASEPDIGPEDYASDDGPPDQPAMNDSDLPF